MVPALLAEGGHAVHARRKLSVIIVGSFLYFSESLPPQYHRIGLCCQITDICFVIGLLIFIVI